MGNLECCQNLFEPHLSKSPYTLAEKGELEKLKDYVLHRPNFSVNDPDIMSEHLVHIACKTGHLEMLRWLVDEAGAILAVQTDEAAGGNYPIHMAAEQGSIEVLQYLIERDGELVSKCNSSGLTALHLASAANHLKVVELLVEKNADVNAIGATGWTPIHFAAYEGHLQVLQFLQHFGGQLDISIEDSSQALHLACLGSHNPMIQYLLEQQEVDVNIAGSSGMYPLHLTAVMGNLEGTKMLVEQGGCEITKKCERLITPLHYACGNGLVEISEFLVKAKPDSINLQGGFDELEGITPLHLAVIGGHVKVCLMLLKEGANIQIKNKQGINALEMAAQGGHTTIVTLLLNNGARISAKLMKEKSDFYQMLKKQKFDGIITLLQVPHHQIGDEESKDEQEEYESTDDKTHKELKRPATIDRDYSVPKDLFPSNEVYRKMKSL
mmetsp:Transcript_28664/g.37567  ORF Transcript_28664/g.37567 Transcript_28664/m.37567 type:complete len:439 (+) Transcript_28664:191-1507(+)|eukprot:CAMPEP_0117757616 /NCGR_PEP_ID=MMETSP0947-20121206/14847_1 /TAXON_ID=44440 /ORGANISM="Chattonella subsalsa, Strain CCMP2191" /LENGTH=438 /DNA_ID=CAMNT_0005577563 /DNA_START=95 /DNA_END=1411 /DNA_ORIENTATION=-